MSHSGPLRALLVLLVILSPVAIAAEAPRPVAVTYRLAEGPTALLSGAFVVEGTLGMMMASELAPGTQFRGVPELVVVDATESSVDTYRNVHVEISTGALLAQRNGSRLVSSATLPYALVLVPPMEGSSEATVVFSAPGGLVNVSADGSGETRLVPADAVVTLRDAGTGRPLDGWDGRRVNAELSDPSDAEGLEVAFLLRGEHAATVETSLFLLQLGAAPLEMGLTLGAAETPRFSEAVEILEQFGALAGGSSEGDGPEVDLAQLSVLSPVLNGALLLLPPSGAGAGAEVAVASAAPAVSAFTLLRSERLEVQFRERDEVRVDGEARLVLAHGEFATTSRAAVAGAVPVLAVFLWVVAVALVVARFVMRKADPVSAGVWRLPALAAHGIAFLVAFIAFDVAFRGAFGTSVLALVGERAFDPYLFGPVAALQLVPFSLASLAFAVPVRLATNAGLRISGRAKGWAGFGRAAGHLVLAAVGPGYILFFLNATVVRGVAQALAGGM